MSELSIKVSIGGRSYPLTINRDEEKIRKAAAEIDKNIKILKIIMQLLTCKIFLL